MIKKYIAYGSNLNTEQMAYRCPNAKLVGISEMQGYELLFRGDKNRAYATIEPRIGKSVPVAIWEINTIDESHLDMYEGYPKVYYKKQMCFMLNGQWVDGMAYIMPSYFEMNHPSSQYLSVIRKGYQDCGMDPKIFDDIIDDFKLLLKNQMTGIRMSR
jgi:hypothetical protein